MIKTKNLSDVKKKKPVQFHSDNDLVNSDLEDDITSKLHL